MTDKRSLFPDGVVVGATQLQNVENSRRFAIQQRQTDLAQAGKSSGFEVTLGTPASRLTLSSGRGYTPRGDFIEHAGQSNLTMADYTDGAVNYICLVYEEDPSNPENHEFENVTRPTIATGTSRVVVMTQTAYENLSVSDGDDLSDNLLTADLTALTRDRTLIIAEVQGQGFGSGIPLVYTGVAPSVGPATGSFADGTITYLRSPGVIFTAEMDPSQQQWIGVNITHLSAQNFVGDGILTMDVNAAGTSYTFSWAGSTSAGVTEATGTASSPLTLANVINEVTLGSIVATKQITLEVVTSLLPVGTGSSVAYTVAVTVSDLYEDVTGPASAKDQRLREKKGRYLPRAGNPHGIGYSNLSENVTVVDKAMTLGTSLLDSAQEQIIPRISIPAVGVTQLFDFPVNSVSGVRAYRSSVSVFYTWNAELTEAGTFRKDTANISTRLVIGSTISIQQHTGTLTATPFAEGAWVNLADFSHLNAASMTLVSTNSEQATLRHLFNSTTAISGSLIQEMIDTAASPRHVRMYRTGDGYFLTTNAALDDSANLYQHDNNAETATGFIFGSAGLECYWKAATVGTWANFDKKLTINGATGDIDYAPAKTFTQTKSPHSWQHAHAATVNHATAYISVGSSAESNSFYLPLELPNGASITSLVVDAYVDCGSGSATLRLFRSPRNNPTSIDYAIGTTFTFVGDTVTSIDNAITVATDVIVNASYTYGLQFVYATVDEAAISGTYITYTLSTLALP